MIDKKHIGYNFPPVTLPVEEGRLKFLAKSLGETKGIYTDPDAAKAAGLPGLLAPPTFPFMLEIDALDLVDFMSVLGETLDKLLHGEENFNYYAPIYAGDSITVCKKITDIVDTASTKVDLPWATCPMVPIFIVAYLLITSND